MVNDELEIEQYGTMVRLRLPSQPRFAQTVRDRLASFALTHGLAHDDARDFLTAVGEALANAMEHAHSSTWIDVSCRLIDDDKIVAAIGFSAQRAEPTMALPDDMAERGRGLPIMRSCSDFFSVRSAPGKGTAVVLGRYLRRPASTERPLASGE